MAVLLVVPVVWGAVLLALTREFCPLGCVLVDIISLIQEWSCIQYLEKMTNSQLVSELHCQQFNGYAVLSY